MRSFVNSLPTNIYISSEIEISCNWARNINIHGIHTNERAHALHINTL
jgi:hypothetical protein